MDGSTGQRWSNALQVAREIGQTTRRLTRKENRDSLCLEVTVTPPESVRADVQRGLVVLRRVEWPLAEASITLFVDAVGVIALLEPVAQENREQTQQPQNRTAACMLMRADDPTRPVPPPLVLARWTITSRDSTPKRVRSVYAAPIL